MKKITKLIVCTIIALSLMISVHAVTITTNTTAGTTDPSSKQITNTSTLTVTGEDTNDAFKAYKI